MEPSSIRAAAARAAASPEFAGVPRLQRFLSFVVETSLDGRAAEIKETLVAVEVYGRPADYSPQNDATVRVEAGRLRARLQRYYEGSGREAAIEIRLPLGTYAPVFRQRPLPWAPRARPRRRPAVAAAAGVMLALAGCGVWWTSAQIGQDAADPAAVEMYLEARQLLRQKKYSLAIDGAVPANVVTAAELFERATRRSPRFAPAWVGLAEANEFAWELDPSRPARRLAAARHAAEQAVALDAKSPEAWNLMASLRFYREFNLPAAEQACQRAIELNPRDTLAQRRYLDLLRIQGRTAEGIAQATLALRQEPLAVTLRIRRAMLLYDTGRWQEAAAEARRAAELNPGRQQPLHGMALWVQGASAQQMGQFGEAERLYRAGLAEEENDTWNGPALGYLLAITGRRAEAERIAAGLARRMEAGKVLHSKLALVYAGLGRHAEAVRLLEQGYAARDPGVLFARIEKRFERLRSDGRFVDFLRRLPTPAPVT